MITLLKDTIFHAIRRDGPKLLQFDQRPEDVRFGDRIIVDESVPFIPGLSPIEEAQIYLVGIPTQKIEIDEEGWETRA